MPLPAPRIDDRDYRALVEETLARVPVHTPEWTNFNPSDPGVTIVQLFASGFGAAIAGVIVNAAGLAGGSVAGTISAANWLYALFAVAPLIAIPPLWSIARTERAPMAVQPAE